MGLLLSITYVQSEIAVEALFETVADVFRQDMTDKLYYPSDATHGVYKQCGPIVTQQFLGPRRAGFVQAAMDEHYYYGIRVYHQRRRLYTLMDTVVTWDADIFRSSRIGLSEARAQFESQPDSIRYNHLVPFMSCLLHLSQRLSTDLVHMMAVDQAAGSATSIHFYSRGEWVDSYYAEDLQENHVRELPQHAEHLRRILGGRFAFLLRQPRRVDHGHGDLTDEYFFVHRHFPVRRFNYWSNKMEERDPFRLRPRGLYIPTWDKNPSPFGAIYCPANKIRDGLYDEFGEQPPAS